MPFYAATRKKHHLSVDIVETFTSEICELEGGLFRDVITFHPYLNQSGGTNISEEVARILQDRLKKPIYGRDGKKPGSSFHVDLVTAAGDCKRLPLTVKKIIASFPLSLDGRFRTALDTIYINPSIDEILEVFNLFDSNKVSRLKVEDLGLPTATPSIFLKVKEGKCEVRKEFAVPDFAR